MIWCVIDVELEEIAKICNTKKEAQEEIKIFKCYYNLMGKKKKYVIEKKDNI